MSHTRNTTCDVTVLSLSLLTVTVDENKAVDMLVGETLTNGVSWNNRNLEIKNTNSVFKLDWAFYGNLYVRKLFVDNITQQIW